MNTWIAVILLAGGALAIFLVPELRRIRARPMQRARIAKMSRADLTEELAINCGIALRHLQGGFWSDVSVSHFRSCIDRAAILHRRIAAQDGLPTQSEAEWRQVVLRDLKALKARRSAAGLPGLPMRIVPGTGDAQKQWVERAVAGGKTAVCWPEWHIDAEGTRRLAVGERAVYISTVGEPMLSVECVGTETRRFEDIDLDLARAEGDHETLEDWRADRRKIFAKRGRWTPGMRIVCERIRVIERFDG